jgi:hypothetical protein
LSSLQVIDDHIIKFLAHIKNASEDDHVVLIETCTVTRSGQGIDICLILRARLVALPSVGFQVEGPHIIELFILFILPSKDD